MSNMYTTHVNCGTHEENYIMIKMPLFRFVVLCWYLLCTNSAYGNIDYRKALYNAFTPYRFLLNRINSPEENEGSFAFYNGKKCHIVNLNLLIRHGSRSPFLSEIKEFNKVHAKLQTIPQAVLKFPHIRRWVNRFPERLAYTQYKEGEKEQHHLAKSYGKMFKNLFYRNMNRIKYTVTKTSVTSQSYRVFSKSLSGFLQSNIPPPRAVIDHTKLHFVNVCKNIDRVDKMAIYQFNLFRNGHEVQNIVAKVKIKLNTTKITTGDVLNLHKMCYFDLMVFYDSKWCNLFDMSDLLVLDYYYDIKRYWKRGYGMQINWQASCPYTSSVFKSFDSFVYGKKPNYRLNVANIDFTHGLEMMSILTAFGLFQDNRPLLASNYEKNMDRLFGQSWGAPMSGNFAVGLYRCGDYDDDYVVKMFHNEESVVIPKCGEKVCPYNDFRWLYSSLTICNFDTLCDNKKK